MKSFSMGIVLLVVALHVSHVGAAVDELVLVNANSSNDLFVLTDGQTIDVQSLPSTSLSVRADVSGAVNSVQFGVNSNSSVQIENVAPYAINGDAGGNYNAWFPGLGTHTITATSWSGANASGTPLGTRTINLTFEGVVGPPPPPPPPPSPLPSPTDAIDAGPARFPVSPQSTATLVGSAPGLPGNAVFTWTQIGGPAATITDPSALTTGVTGLTASSVHVFQLTGTESGNSVADTVVVATLPTGSPTGTVSGETRLWHDITLTFDGPQSSETATGPNPFRTYRMTVFFQQGSRTFEVPGYFAADGDAAESSAESGNKWRAHFVPDATGSWNYTVLFQQGTDLAVDEDLSAGSIVTTVHGARGSFNVLPTDKSAPDFRGRGLLEITDSRYLRFKGDNTVFLKGGADSPENFLAYVDFDGTFDNDGNFLHDYAPHAGDWDPGDPEWQNDKGTEIIGALNYLASKQMNSVYFLTMNVTGDGDDVWPWTGPNERYRFDCSKLDQWEIVFDHMDQLGIQLHVLTQEVENIVLLDGGALGTERRLYYRELIARFSHHLAVVWNLGEENLNTEQQRRDFGEFFARNDPYRHPTVLHTYPNQYENVYAPLLGFPSLDGLSIQTASDLSGIHALTIDWIDRSESAGKPWFVCIDEPGSANAGIVPDNVDPTHDNERKNALWSNLIAGGSGVEWYFGYAFPNDDLDCEDWRSRDNAWDMTRHALSFFAGLPVDTMTTNDDLVTSGTAWCLASPGDTYAFYLNNGGSITANMTDGQYEARWFDPRNGGFVGAPFPVTGTTATSIGPPPNEPGQDWAIEVRRTVLTTPNPFIRGDATADGLLNLADAVAMLSVLFAGEFTTCADAYDADDSGQLSLNDAVRVLGSLFSGASLPEAPYPSCGDDPTSDSLGCGLTNCP